MGDKVWIQGKEYDASNIPAWYEHFVPGGLLHKKTLDTAKEQAEWNRPRNAASNLILLGIGALWLVALVWFLAVI